jgi:hypothetical protein
MAYLAATLAAFVLGVTITVIISRAFNGKIIFFIPQASMSILNGAQHAANQSRHDQLVVYDGTSFRIVRANNNYSVDGIVVHIAHPEAI